MEDAVGLMIRECSNTGLVGKTGLFFEPSSHNHHSTLTRPATKGIRHNDLKKQWSTNIKSLPEGEMARRGHQQQQKTLFGVQTGSGKLNQKKAGVRKVPDLG